MFTWLNKQGVRSDKGFEVQSINRFVIRYTEKNGEIDVSVEYGQRGSDYFIYIYDKEFYQWKDGRKISDEKKNKF